MSNNIVRVDFAKRARINRSFPALSCDYCGKYQEKMYTHALSRNKKHKFCSNTCVILWVKLNE